MKVPLEQPKTSSGPEAVQRAAIMLSLLRDEEQQATKKVITAIHESADERGAQIAKYLDETKKWIRDMKEIAQS